MVYFTNRTLHSMAVSLLKSVTICLCWQLNNQLKILNHAIICSVHTLTVSTYLILSVEINLSISVKPTNQNMCTDELLWLKKGSSAKQVGGHPCFTYEFRRRLEKWSFQTFYYFPREMKYLLYFRFLEHLFFWLYPGSHAKMLDTQTI